MSESKKVYYIPIVDPNWLLEGNQNLLRTLVTRIIEGNINGRTNYTEEPGIKRVRVTRIVIDYVD